MYTNDTQQPIVSFGVDQYKKIIRYCNIQTKSCKELCHATRIYLSHVPAQNGMCSTYISMAAFVASCDAELDSVEMSCGCTTARITVGD